MKLYLMSFCAGLLVGVIYALMNVRSPAPPIVALVGLLGILLGEQFPPFFRSLWSSQPVVHSWEHQFKPHVFGHLPRGATPRPTETPDKTRG